MTLEYTAEFTAALDQLNSGHGMFLTGKAGTGKSTLIGEFLRQTTRRVRVTGTTGIAALNIRGETVHRAFGLRPDTTVTDVQDGTYRPGARVGEFKAMDTLIIDEASMMRADVFDVVAEILCLHGPMPGELFGGVQLVLVGDLHQLPPVVTVPEQEYFRTTYESPFFFSARSYSRTHLPPVQLTKVFRQAGDQELKDLLNAVRDGLATAQVRDSLNRQVREDFEPPIEEFWLTLTTRNKIAAARNRARLDQLAGDAVVATAVISGDIDGAELPNDKVIHYKAGAQIMMLTNDQGGRWVNGSMGTITAVADGTDEVTVDLRDGGSVEVSPHRWETTRTVMKDGHLRREVVGTFTQLPFKLAWAITIHKSQGQTLERILVDLSGGSFEGGQTYVALSRATSLKGIVLTDRVKARELKVDPRVVRFLAPRVASVATAPRCAIAVSTIGEDFFADRARPVEIGVAFEDGTGISTVVNPQRDPGDALSDHDLSNDEILMAPTLPDAWAVIAPFVAGHTPMGRDVDRIVAVLDHEFKRHGCAVRLPLGTVVPHSGAQGARTALQRAREDLRLVSGLTVDPAAQVFGGADSLELPESGYLLSRDTETLKPPATTNVTAATLLSQSLALSGIAILGQSAEVIRDRGSVDSGLAATAIARRLKQTIREAGRLSGALIDRISEIERLLAIPILGAVNTEGSDVGSLLGKGVAICFTGSMDGVGDQPMSKKELAVLAQQNGMIVVDTVTKRRCNVLVTAQMGSQSGKAKAAQRFGIPTVSASEFLDWAYAQSSSASL